MGKINSRQKGARAERMLRDIFIAHGFSSRRGCQFSGSPDSPDVVVPDLPWLHVECKFVEDLDLYKAVEQAERDAGPKFPVVFSKKSHKDWLVTMSVESFFELLIKCHDLEQHEVNHINHTEISSAPGQAEVRRSDDPSNSG